MPSGRGKSSFSYVTGAQGNFARQKEPVYIMINGRVAFEAEAGFEIRSVEMLPPNHSNLRPLSILQIRSRKV